MTRLDPTWLMLSFVLAAILAAVAGTAPTTLPPQPSGLEPNGTGRTLLSSYQAPGIYVMSAGGAGQARLTRSHHNRHCTPARSPDGSRIALRACGVTGPVVMSAGGANQTGAGSGSRFTRAP